MCVVRFGTRSRLDELVDVVDQERRYRIVSFPHPTSIHASQGY